MAKLRKRILVGHVERMEGMRQAYYILFGKSEGKASFGIWMDNIKIVLKDKR